MNIQYVRINLHISKEVRKMTNDYRPIPNINIDVGEQPS